MSLPRVVGVLLLLAVVGGGAWYLSRPAGEEQPIRQRLEALAEAINRSTVDGAGLQARARELAGYFTDDVEVELGGGSAPIRGRDTLIGMAERLQPRTAMFRLQFEDVTVAMAPGGDAADVHLTAEFIRRSITSGEETLDAREFTVGMRRVGGIWQISRITAIDTLK